MSHHVRMSSSAMFAALWCVSFGWSAASAQTADSNADAANPPARAVIPWDQHFAEQPATFRWSFSGSQGDAVIAPLAAPEHALTGRIVGLVKLGVEGPRPSLYPAFPADNTAVEFQGNGGSIRFADLGDNSPLDFDQGDAITLEAWVNVTKLGGGQQMYVFGKGRTRNPGVAAENQNYALRLSGVNGQACLSFLFRDRVPGQDSPSDFHRWNSKESFAPNSGWHHIAVSYVFGDPKSIRGYLDGQPCTGAWDFGGATEEPPVVDNDELWIGSSMGGNPGSTFHGSIDEIAIHRRVVTAEEMSRRYVAVEPPSYVTEVPLPQNAVLVEVFHDIPDKPDFKFPVPEPFERFEWPGFVMTELPHRYNKHGVRDDRSNPLMIRLSGWVTWPAGEVQLRIRTRGAARLLVDGQLVGTVDYAKQLGDGSDGNGGLYPVPGDDPAALRDVATGDRESLVTLKTTGQPQRVELNLFAGGKKRRTEVGETTLSWAPAGSDSVSQVVAYDSSFPLTNADWWRFEEDLDRYTAAFNQTRRLTAAKEWAEYWDTRHARARRELLQQTPVATPQIPSGVTARQAIDQIVAAGLTTANVAPRPLVDDWTFLRRASLDLIGIVPTDDIVQQFFADPPATRRAQLIERLLEHPGWADHWVGYWQDVLAENPNIINPTLNNTGPFRFWLHESFSDNKPFDRFVTELILMEGSSYYGGPAGFAVASQNDSPMAAKAHILSQAFMGMEMKCARCHDAPYHDFLQKDLFSIAAMLNRSPLSVPKTSTISGDPAALQSLLVKVTLKPGEAVPAEWPFADRFSGELATDILLNPEDRREQLAAIITAPSNERFQKVIVNRVWRRYLGRGLVEPVDDWESAEPSHPELLQHLSREFVLAGYDLKWLARTILNSQLYQRAANPEAAVDERAARLFAGPAPRRMTAEQVVDSLFVVSGKPMNCEPLNIDVDTMRAYTSSINLGSAKRAWQFTSMSNERDRPSLSLPGAQTIVDVLETFGWRSTRPDPLTIRPQETTVLQPAILANGVVAKRVTQMSDDSRFTALALKDLPLNEFIDAVCQAILTRPATADEQELFQSVLSPGYAERVVPGEVSIVRTPRVTSIGVAWTNHLHPEANERKVALKHRLDLGDPPTQRLVADWRERAEDMIWTFLNSPEFLFVQ